MRSFQLEEPTRLGLIHKTIACFYLYLFVFRDRQSTVVMYGTRLALTLRCRQRPFISFLFNE